MSAKGKYGLVYKRPENCDKPRTHEEVAKDESSLKEGLASKRPMRPEDNYLTLESLYE